MVSKYFQLGRLSILGVLCLGMVACSGSDETSSEQVSPPEGEGGGSAGAAGTNGQGGSVGTDGGGGQSNPSNWIPATYAGYTGCTASYCADAARACDDFLRSGCGKAYEPISDPGTGDGDDAYHEKVGQCAVALVVWAGEYYTEERKHFKDASRDQAMRQLLTLSARCTRQAHSCEDMGNCLRGQMLGFSVPMSKLSALPPPPSLPAAVDVPAWKRPFDGIVPDVMSGKTPWGKAPMLISVDSVTCAACAVDRCPDFAYRCFGAIDSAEDCPSGDCCQSFRACVDQCGGYAPKVSVARFDRCVAICSEGRPSAIQELADLQGCVENVCKGCETLDNVKLVEAP